MKLGRRKPEESLPSGQNPYLGLRAQFLALGPEQLDVQLRGVALEIGMASGVATIVCCADGTTSFYTSSGGGYLGMGGHQPVRQASAAFLTIVAGRLATMAPVDDVPLPGAGQVNVVAVTADGLRLLRCPESEARTKESPAYLCYLAGQSVITQIRLVAEAQGA